MRNTLGLFAAAAVTVLFAFAATPASAQATRTWVSGVGDDVNPCSRTAPCKTFAGAISKTATNGEINCLDPGGFGNVTITKSITIDCTGTFGSILNTGVSGIVISNTTPVGANITLRGLLINGAGSTVATSNGIRILGSTNVVIENVRIHGQTGQGIDVQPSTAGVTKLDIKDTTVHTIASAGTTTGGILLKPGATASVQASLTRVNMHTGQYGLRVEDRAKATVFEGVASNNSGNGFLAVSASAAAEIVLINSVAANTTTNGVATSGALASVRMINSVTTGNGVGLSTAGGGTIAGTTPDTNLNIGNGADNGPNQNVTLH